MERMEKSHRLRCLSQRGRESGVYVTVCLALFITFATIHANIAGFSRMVYALAREGHIPLYFGKLSETKHTPIRVLIVLAAVFGLVLAAHGLFQIDLTALLKGRVRHSLPLTYVQWRDTETAEMERFRLVDGARGVCGVRSDLHVQRLGNPLSGGAGDRRVSLYEDNGMS